MNHQEPFATATTGVERTRHNEEKSSGRRALSFKDYLQREENVICGRTFRSEWSNLLLAVVLLVIADIIVFAFPGSVSRIFLTELGSIPIGFVLPLPLIAPLMVFLALVARVYDEKYVIGMDSLLLVTGLSKFSMKTTEIFYDNVISVSVEQAPVERMMNVGTVTVQLPGESMTRLSLKGVRNPSQYKSMIERRLPYNIQ